MYHVAELARLCVGGQLARDFERDVGGGGGKNKKTIRYNGAGVVNKGTLNSEWEARQYGSKKITSRDPAAELTFIRGGKEGQAPKPEAGARIVQ